MAWKVGDICLSPAIHDGYFRQAEIIDILTNSKGVVFAVVQFQTNSDEFDEAPRETVGATFLLDIPPKNRYKEWQIDDECLVYFRNKDYFRQGVILHLDNNERIAAVRLSSVSQSNNEPSVIEVSDKDLRIISQRKTGVSVGKNSESKLKDKIGSVPEKKEWSKGDLCLAPTKDDVFREAKITDIHKTFGGTIYAEVQFVDVKQTDRLEIGSICVVPSNDQDLRLKVWKENDVCLVYYPDNNYFILAIVVDIQETDEGKMAQVKQISASSKSAPIYVPVFNLKIIYKRQTVLIPKTKGIFGKIAIGALGAIGLGVLIPVAIPVAVGALGFGAGGIVAGTPAAAFMASYGGAVASGSVCAVLQSIGAAGLGAVGTLFGGAAGVVVGGAAGAAAGEAVDRKMADEEQKKKI